MATSASDGLGPLHRNVLVFVGKGLERLVDRIEQYEAPELPTRQILEHVGFPRAGIQAPGASDVRQCLRDLVDQKLLTFNHDVREHGFDFYGSAVRLTDLGLVTVRQVKEWKRPESVRSWLEPVGCHLQVALGGDIQFQGAKLSTGRQDEDRELNQSNLAVALAILARALRIEEYPMRIVDLQEALLLVQPIGLEAKRTRTGFMPTEYAISKSLERLASSLPFINRRQRGRFGEWWSKVIVPFEFFDRFGERMRFHEVMQPVESRLGLEDFRARCAERRKRGPSKAVGRQAGES